MGVKMLIIDGCVVGAALALVPVRLDIRTGKSVTHGLRVCQ